MYVLYHLHHLQTVTYICVFQQAQDDEETLRVIMQVRRLTYTLVMDSFERNDESSDNIQHLKFNPIQNMLL